MACLCQKLFAKQYSGITESEAELLKRTSTEAPHLFLPSPLSPLDETQSARKRPRIPRGDTANLAETSQQSGPTPHLDSITTTLPQPQEPCEVASSLSPSTKKLVQTYPSQSSLQVSTRELTIHQADDSDSVFVKLFLAYEEGGRRAESQQAIQRICCYAFAQLHPKGCSYDDTVRDIEHALPSVQRARDKVYHICRIGNKWIAIVEKFASIVERDASEVTGLLRVLEKATVWERASTEDYTAALTHLRRTTDVCERTIAATRLVGEVLSNIKLQHSFVSATTSRTLTSSAPGKMPLPQYYPRNVDRVTTVYRALRTSTEAQPPWKLSSLAAVPKKIFDQPPSEDAGILLVLLSFLSPCNKIPLSLLSRGAAQVTRWTCRDSSRFFQAIRELELSSTISKVSDNCYILDAAVGSSVHQHLSPELITFWKRQAITVAARSIPWKYLKSPDADTKLFLPHLRHAVEASMNDVEQLPLIKRAELALTLAEASRLLDMSWRRFATEKAAVIAEGLEDRYVLSCVAQSRCTLSRITGRMDRAVGSLRDIAPARPSDTMDPRLHAAIGQTAIQKALNCVQVEDFSGGKAALESWTPLHRLPTPMEETVLFRKAMVLGKILRLQGDFERALTHLQRAWEAAQERADLVFDEDMRDTVCELADTLRELDRPVCAEQYLRGELARRQHCFFTSRGSSLVELSLAEALFAQKRLDEAEKVCLLVQLRPELLRLEKLRLHITLAKIRHMRSDFAGALSSWSEAMKAIGKFPRTNGRATRMIVISICDTLRVLGHSELLDKSLKQVASLDELAKPGAAEYWIAGLRHWLDYLQSRRLQSHV